MTDIDILDRNDDLNKRVNDLSSTYTRRRVVDTLLVIIIFLVAVAITVFVVLQIRTDNKIEHTDVSETQLICTDLQQEDHVGHNIYAICNEVGAPKMIGAVK
jgi:beta-lactamase regulating signal transducer with metallopeptidase domain